MIGIVIAILLIDIMEKYVVYYQRLIMYILNKIIYNYFIVQDFLLFLEVLLDCCSFSIFMCFTFLNVQNKSPFLVTVSLVFTISSVPAPFLFLGWSFTSFWFLSVFKLTGG